MDNSNNRNILILYGSQTGYAEDVARRIARQAWRRHFIATVSSMDKIDWATALSEGWVVFVCSTTGQGEEPDNMKKFWRFLLRKSIPHDALEGMNFAVFGLGDSSYQKYNFPAKRLYRRLQQLGATPLLRRGDGDDQHYLGIDGALDPWLTELWDVTLKHFPLPDAIIPDSVTPNPMCSVQFANTSRSSPDLNCKNSGLVEPLLPFDADETPFNAVLTTSERITALDHFQDVRHFQFKVDPHVIQKWNPGDCAVVRPNILDADVSMFLEMMGWGADADRELKIAPLDGSTLPTWLPLQNTLRWLFTNFFDIMAVPRRSFFEMLSYFADNEDEKEKLQEFSSSAGQDELQTYCMRPRRTIMESLADFPNSRVPLEYIFDVFPAIAERSFSISSSSAVTPQYIDITVAIVKYKTKMYIPRVGVCTRWMKNLSVGDCIPMRLSKGTMRLPSDNDIPIIMVGPGTGIGAFMSFIRTRIHNGTKENYLFFGCRSKDKDFYYKDQLIEWQKNETLKLFCAFSRDQETKRYVQHLIAENSAIIWNLIDKKNAVIYVSGNANNMPDDVRSAFTNVVAKSTSASEDQAKQYIDRMIRERRYQEECWY